MQLNLNFRKFSQIAAGAAALSLAFATAQAAEKKRDKVSSQTDKPAAAAQLVIDPSASSVAWVGKKVTGQHNGTVGIKGGMVELKDKELVGGNLEIDMTSIQVLDLKPEDEYNAKLVGHLKSGDFFGVDAHPTATFKITRVKALTKPAANGATHEISGDMTIKGISKPVTFPAKVSVSGDAATAEGTLTLDRTKWNITYRSGSIIKNLGDKLIHDDFTLDLKLVAKKN